MKPLLILLLTASLSFAGVEITDTGRVLKDGADIGALPDAILNKVVTPSEVQTALLAKLTESAAKEAKLAAFLAKAKEAFNAGDFDAAKAILNPEITKVEQSEKDKRKAELEEQKAKIQAELDALDAKAAAIKSKPVK